MTSFFDQVYRYRKMQFVNCMALTAVLYSTLTANKGVGRKFSGGGGTEKKDRKLAKNTENSTI